MNFNPESTCRVMPSGDNALEKTSIQVYSLILLILKGEADLVQDSKAIWAGQAAPADEGEVEEDSHVIESINPPSSKHDRRSLEHLRAKVARQLRSLERILAAKKKYSAASLMSIFLYDASYLSLPSPPLSVSRLDHEVRHIIEVFEEQRKLEISRIQGYALSTLSQDKMSSSTPCLSVGSIYRKLYHRFLACRILKRTQTIHNRRTFIPSYESVTIEEDNTDNEWISESRVEKVQRSLEASGIKISHAARKWNDDQHRYGCFQPSLLRWSWTTFEDVESEDYPNEEQ